ncbi:hypothetical protein Dimus_030706, partial [Dionaea muscipula]
GDFSSLSPPSPACSGEPSSSLCHRHHWANAITPLASDHVALPIRSTPPHRASCRSINLLPVPSRRSGMLRFPAAIGSRLRHRRKAWLGMASASPSWAIQFVAFVAVQRRSASRQSKSQRLK